MSSQNKEQQNEQNQEQPQKREIIIETDGNEINIKKAEVAGNLELIAILDMILEKIRNK